MMIKKLKKISREILSANTGQEIETAGIQLQDFYFSNGKPLYSNKDVRLDSGLAISPNASKKCLKEYLRTIFLIQGVKKHLDKIKTGIIVYAGCGVYAPLLLTVLHYYHRDAFKITLIDANPESIASVSKLIENFGYHDYNIELICEDASRHNQKEPDVLICECMYRGLTNEPQIHILDNFNAKQVIPEKVEISVSDYDIKNKIDHKEEIHLCTISNECKEPGQYLIDTSDYVGELCLHTRINVYDGLVVDRNQADITESFVLTKGKSKTRLKYKKSNIPAWEGILIN